jgi:uncharacterized repeat protein (TIGR03803 family)
MGKGASSTVSLRNLSICVVIFASSVLAAAAKNEKALYSFGTKSGDGTLPGGGLIADAAGNLYGTTVLGGAANSGAVYELSPPVSPNTPWTETVLYSFSGGTDGSSPVGNLVLDTMGNLYGTASGGGNPSCPFGCGTVYELSPPVVQGGNWTKTTVYSFGGGNDGQAPDAGLIFDQVGNLYGTTALGGSTLSCDGQTLGCGTVFELSPPAAPGGAWTERILYSFTGASDGGLPQAPVVLDNAGNLYGSTAQGGDRSCLCGTVFELVPSGAGASTETVLHTFTGINGDGGFPGGADLFLNKAGELVGTTEEGGSQFAGTVFGLKPPLNPGGKWTYGVLYNFVSPSNMESPDAGVILVEGRLYGTTFYGGPNSLGTIFQLTRTRGEVWNESAVFNFDGTDGANPEAGLLFLNGAAVRHDHEGRKRQRRHCVQNRPISSARPQLTILTGALCQVGTFVWP